MYVSMKLTSFIRWMATTAAVAAMTTIVIVSGVPPSDQHHDPTPDVSVLDHRLD
ncbi:MAG TPA: hypothetical protein VM677_26135 [Actinokineospora sp.]|jgi:hypothetical protein|nr:hypothetical protein [Actinokineospora sp.]